MPINPKSTHASHPWTSPSQWPNDDPTAERGGYGINPNNLTTQPRADALAHPARGIRTRRQYNDRCVIAEASFTAGVKSAGAGLWVARQIIRIAMASTIAAPTLRCHAIRPSGRVPLLTSGIVHPRRNCASTRSATSQCNMRAVVEYAFGCSMFSYI